jgi:hypothetical protein
LPRRVRSSVRRTARERSGENDGDVSHVV